MSPTSVLIPDRLKAQLEYRAVENCRSLSSEIVYILKNYLRFERDADVNTFKELVSGRPRD